MELFGASVGASLARRAALLVMLVAVLAQPDLISMVPASGPVEGGTRLTIAGAGLILSDTSRICRFGHGPGSEVPATFEGRSSHGRVFCTAPPARSGYVVDVELSIDGGGSFVGRDFTFTYFHEAVVSSVSPNSGPAVGATLVRVTGFNFAPTAGLSCLFGWRRAPATYLDFQTVRCAAPEHAANSSLRLSFDGAPDNELGLALEDAAVDLIGE